MRTFLGLSVALVAACGGSENKVAPDAPSGHPVDAPQQAVDAPVQQPDAPSPDATVTVPDAPAAACLIAAQLGTLAPIAPTVSEDADPPTFMEYDDSINADAVPDTITIQLFGGYGAFATDPIGPKTIDLTGAETGFDTCGGCVMLYGDNDPSSGPTTTYMPTGGTLTITQVSPHFTATLTNVTFVHVDIDSSTLATTANADGCASTLDSLSFDMQAAPTTDGGVAPDAGTSVDGGMGPAAPRKITLKLRKLARRR